MEPQMEHARSWLCPEPGDRERMLDMDRRLRLGRNQALLLVAASLLACIPFLGWLPVGVLVGGGGVLALVQSRVASARKPEWLIAAGWLTTVVAISIGVLLSGGADSPAKSWLLIPAITLPARFTKRGMIVGLVITLAALAVVTIGADPGRVLAQPQLFVFPAALIGAALALSMALRGAELQHRADAVIDPLTGMLNRKALETRTTELEQQSRVSREPVGLIVCDIDHFKAVNDTHGHATGDAALIAFAYRIRKELRAYDLAYRLGGEEFVVLVPGADGDSAHELAERLRAAVAHSPVANVALTASFGVAASGEAGLDFEELFAEADGALYRAKADGRNRVRGTEAPAVALLV